MSGLIILPLIKKEQIPMKPIGHFSTSPLAENIESLHGSCGQSMPLNEAIQLAQSILQFVQLGKVEDIGVLVFLATLINEKTIAGERASVIPESIPFTPPVTFEMPY